MHQGLMKMKALNKRLRRLEDYQLALIAGDAGDVNRDVPLSGDHSIKV